MEFSRHLDEDSFENHWSVLERITRFCSYVYYILCRVVLYEQVDFDIYDEMLGYYVKMVQLESKAN